ncbi:unnamed protein product [Trypanosoma congolense IL3000]|uniref:WGS project CAEQ00000000 data, annotated contig 2145 n=1 Tax=Trypanosoma congolense (strain IL3000) TaxID=1068625 RepID=F9WBT4_TRYCI|nr:unnamed protein product [Trypanosoma congolense IL3000]
MSLIISQVLLASSPNITTYLAALCGSLLNVFISVPSPPQWRFCHAGEARDSCFVAVPFLPTRWLSPMPAVTPLHPVLVETYRRRDRAPNAAWGEPALWDPRPPSHTVRLTTSALVYALPPIWKAVSSCTELHCSFASCKLTIKMAAVASTAGSQCLSANA